MQQVQANPFDREEMLERLGGDTDLLADVLQVFLEECPRMFEEVRCAVDEGDSNLVRRSAHSMKGALLNISAAPAAAEASRLEVLGSEDRIDDAVPALERLRREIDRLQHALAGQTSG